MNPKRNLKQLEQKAVMWWPESLTNKNAQISIIPRLIETQDQFLKIISLAKDSPTQIFDLIQAANFSANLFLKHLSVLSDYGGEPIQRLGRSFSKVFFKRGSKFVLIFSWNGKNHNYLFKSLPIKGLGNKKLFIDADGLQTNVTGLPDLYKDMIMILMHGSASQSSEEAGLNSCEIGTLMGNDEELEKFVKQRYILVSRITGGATANSLGQLLQKEVFSFLRKSLSKKYSIKSNGSIKLKGYAKRNGMPFDIVISRGKVSIGIEISFQVTTNRTIERKAGQAADRLKIMNKNGHHIAYIIDGAGNFQRQSALSTICKNSECTVAFAISELKILKKWIESIYD